MDLLFWITVGFIIIGFIVLASMKRNMESKLAFIKGNMESKKSSSAIRSIVWWIVGTTAWGIVSMTLVVWWFSAK
ncbi:hypothetical protein JSQ81_06295 [Sporosarcina sp. Marseille-Q4063]|uniref:hypothetical protein n=1 Tax=Sporosarcina sp. Marseille-Q4063 TaxID=2810514 RepID=UPI001BAE918C|nr:hypothetical protein [Sporosarcina sp. Marseille-Q4063]QUW23169.1 hypothetical protein JSQ81_06295 [Sporosarcina sp. Marseille-Q4063]